MSLQHLGSMISAVSSANLNRSVPYSACKACVLNDRHKMWWLNGVISSCFPCGCGGQTLWFANSRSSKFIGDVLHLASPLDQRQSGREGEWSWPECALTWWRGLIWHHPPLDTPASPRPSLILSSHDSRRPALVFHSLCMAEHYCIMFF